MWSSCCHYVRSRTAMRKLAPAIACALIVALGCSQAARDRLKHFFFEVPSAEVTPTLAEATPPPSEEPPELVLPGPRFRSTHPPYVQRLCKECHSSDNRMQVRADFLDQCRTCHARYFSDEVGHPPVADGECLICHEPHRSMEAALLRLPVLDTCVNCHDEPEDLSEEAHGAGDVDNCTTCHDPHFGGAALLKPQTAKGT